MPPREGSIVEPEARGLVDVLRPDGVAAREVGDRAGHAQDAAVAAGAEAAAVVDRIEPAPGGGRGVGELAQQRAA